MNYEEMGMLDIAYSILDDATKELNFHQLYDEICEKKGLSEEEKMAHMSSFYTNITLDGRFITLGENTWDLRKKHKFENVHIDMNDIYQDTEDEEDVYEEDEEEDGVSQEDSYDDLDN